MPMTGESGRRSGKPPVSGRFWDLMSAVAVALLLVVVFVGGMDLASAHGVSEFWVFTGGMGFALALGIGWTVRSLFNRRLFLPYFVAWMVAQTGSMVVAIKDYGTIAALPAMLVLIFLGYTLTFWLFGVPPNLKRK